VLSKQTKEVESSPVDVQNTRPSPAEFRRPVLELQEREVIALEKIAEALTGCHCGHRETIHLPKCMDAHCECPGVVPELRALVNVMEFTARQIMDFKNVMAAATGVVKNKNSTGLIIPN
jgi:hypothetical protein